MELVPEWKTIVRKVNSLFRNTTAPHAKSNGDTLNEVLKMDWKINKPSKYIYPELMVEEEEEY